ncbi:MAG: DUF2029 domain-containing protein [Acidobacteriia bacterium]|nr:DUF2029 domain-containing protein [Terriglobia bacterium]
MSPDERDTFRAMAMSRLRAVLLDEKTLAAIVLAGVTLWTNYLTATKVASIDFFHYWFASRAVSERMVPDIYSDEGRRLLSQRSLELAAASRSQQLHKAATAVAKFNNNEVHTTGTPFAYCFFGLFSTGEYRRDLSAYALFCTACLAVSILVLCRTLGFSLAASLVILVVTATSAPLNSEILVGNVNQIQLALLAAIVWLQSRRQSLWADLLTGAVGVTAAMFKPNLALVGVTLAAVWACNRRLDKLGRVALGGAAGAALVAGISMLYFGSANCFGQWLQNVPRLMRNDYTLEMGNFSLPRILSGTLHFDPSWILLVGLLAVFVVCALLGRGRGGDPGEESFRQAYLAVCIAAAISLVATPLIWLHYFLLTFPLAIYLLQPRLSSPRAVVVLRVMTAVALLFLSKPMMENEVLDYPTKVAVTNLGVLMLLAGGLWQLMTLKRDDPAPLLGLRADGTVSPGVERDDTRDGGRVSSSRPF